MGKGRKCSLIPNEAVNEGDPGVNTVVKSAGPYSADGPPYSKSANQLADQTATAEGE